MASTAKIIELRNLLRERFPAAHQERHPEIETFATGLPCLDDAGLPKGALTELVSPRKSGGSALLLRRLIENLATNGQYLTLVDGRDSFDPQSVGPAACERLLWVRCRSAKETVQAADLLLRDGNLPFVVIDLQFNPEYEVRRLPGQTWYRLQTLVAKTNATCLIMTPTRRKQSHHFGNGQRTSVIRPTGSFAPTKIWSNFKQIDSVEYDWSRYRLN